MSKPPPMPIIAGANAGVKVRVSNPAFAVIFNNLETLARQGNYHAAVAVNHIRSLSSGNMKPNVYVHDSLRDDKNWVFTMILPGCRMELEKRSNGEFLVYGLVADENYLEMQKEGERPGLFHLTKEPNSDRWKADLARNGKIAAEPLRTVIVADRARTLAEAIRAAVEQIGKAPIGGTSDMWNTQVLICTLLRESHA